ncbi:MAG: MBL fold metallo-hydrolase RNA specificity domain-containing protein [Pauljensenia sp.]
MGSTTLTFLGAASTVTGSKFLLTLDDGEPSERRILVDSGLFQGEKRLRRLNWADFPVPPSSVSDVLVTHAHLDHCGYLPRLVRHGFAGTIWATRNTISLCEIVLRDSAFLQERDADHARSHGYSRHRNPEPLYRIGDVGRTLPLFREVAFDTDIDLGGGVSARWTHAGHILGSASIRVHAPRGPVLFSGDIGRTTHPVLKAREVPEGAGVVLVESTYGDREHPDPGAERHKVFADAIRRTVERGGSVLVPAFAVDRTEVVLAALTEMQEAGRIPELPIFVDSPMALASLRVYQSPAAAAELRPDLRGLRLPSLDLREVHTVEESKLLNRPHRPCLIISASGMATGGRVLHHLEHMLPDARHTVVLTGYQAVGTRGRALADGATQLKMHGAHVAVVAEVVRDEEFSVHADGSDTLDWLAALRPRPRRVFCVHGESDSAWALAQRITAELGIEATVPGHLDTVQVG